MTQSMEEHFKTYACNYKDNISNIKDNNGFLGSINYYDNIDDLIKIIRHFKIHQLNQDGTYKAKYQFGNKTRYENIKVLGFFDATEYILNNGNTTYLSQFMILGGIVRINNIDFASRYQVALMSDTAHALKNNKNK